MLGDDGQPKGRPHLDGSALATPGGRAEGLLLLGLRVGVGVAALLDLWLPRPGLHAHVEVHLVVGQAGATRAHLAPRQDVLPLFPVKSVVL